jgi:cytochrome c oxidase assembly factor CtaG
VGLGAFAALVVLVPPLSVLARRYEALAALQFGVLAIAVPALLAVGAPWAQLGLSGQAQRLADARKRHPQLARALGFVGIDLVAIVLWRTPAGGDAVQRHPWMVLVQAVVLVPLGIGLWLEIVESPPLVPRSPRPYRAALAAVAMWVVWTMAYLVAMSHAAWYPAFHHVSTSLSAGADRQLSSVVLWFVAAASFMPVIFVNLVSWLRSEEEDADTELHQLIREERRRAVPAPPSAPQRTTGDDDHEPGTGPGATGTAAS